MPTKVPATMIATTGVTPGSYTAADITVNDSGQITSAASNSLVAGGGGSPKITAITVTDSSYNNLDDTAVALTGGFIRITGTGFVTGCQVIIGSLVATSVSFISATQVRAQVPAQAAGTYTVYLVNSDGGVGIRVNGLNYSSTPTWTTTSPLGDGAIDTAVSIQLVATSNSTVTYTLAQGSTLPTGLTLSSSGLLSGTVTGISVNTTYNFTVIATDSENQDTPQAFQITIVIGDPYYGLVTLHLPGTGTNLAQNNTFQDSSTNNFTITRNGNTTQGTFSPFSQTGWGNYFDGTGDYLSWSGTTIGSSAFTFECWFYCTGSFGSNQTLLGAGSDTTNRLAIKIASSTSIQVDQYGVGSQSFTVPTMSLNTWYYLVAVRDGSNNETVWLNGTRSSTGTLTDSKTYGVCSTIAYNTPSYNQTFTGYISNLKLDNSANYSTSSTTITVPVSPLSSGANTQLLTCQSNRFIDNSTNNFTITRNGDTRVVAFSPFNPTASWSAAVNGGSGYFDGSGDYLQSTITALPAQFTVEFWFYRSSTGNNFMFTIGDAINNTGAEVYIGTNGTVLNYYSNGNARITATAPNTGTWSYIVVTRDASNVVRLYLDGVQVGGTYTQAATLDTVLRVGAEYYNAAITGVATGYISGFRVSNTARTISVPVQPFANDANTVCLLNFTNAGILDSTTKNVLETVGDAKISTAQSRWGGSSMSFDGTGDYLLGQSNVTNSLGGSDFTIEFWVYSNSVAAEQIIVDFRTGSGSVGPTVGHNAGGAVFFQTSGVNRITGSNLSANTWTHIAVTKSGSSTKLFINGTQSGSTYSDSNTYTSPARIFVGADDDGSSNAFFNGYLQDLRVTRGYARYTTNFTPPTGAFPAL